MRATTHPLACKQINHPARHNPRQPKATEESIPYGTSHLTVEKKMVHKLPIPFPHAAPINHNDMLVLKIIHGKDFS
jgi:hypothetical protein